MIIQNYFPHEAFRDSKLITLLLYALLNAKSNKSSYCFRSGDIIELNPFQVPLDRDKVSYELGISDTEFDENIQKIEKLKKVMKIERTDGVLLQFMDIDSNISSLHFKPEEIEGQSISISKWIELDYDNFVKLKSKSLQRDTPHALKLFQDIVGDKALSQVNKNDYYKFIKAKEGKIENKSINCYTRNIKASIRRAKTSGYILEDPFKGLKQLPESRKKELIWEDEEIQFIRSQVNDRNYLHDAISIALLSGMRRGELMNLLWDNVDMDERFIHVKDTEQHKTKFHKERKIPICDDLRNIFKRIHERNTVEGIESVFVICNTEGNKISDETVTKEVRKIVKAEQMRDGLNFHGFRRTFASSLRKRGVPISIISAILGHSNEHTTNLYLNVPEADLYKAVESLSINNFFGERGGNV